MRLMRCCFCLLVVIGSAPGLSLAQPPKSKVLPGWGESVNPRNDCKFKATDGALKLTLPAVAHDLSVEIHRMNAPRVIQPVKTDFILQVKVSGVSHPGAQSVIPGRRPFCSAGLLVWQDEWNYIRFERASLLNGGNATTYASWELRQDGKFARAGRGDELPLGGLDSWLRVTRRGNTFSAAASADGQNWSPLPDIKLAAKPGLQVGILAVNDTPAPFSPQFQDFSLEAVAAP